MGAGALLAAHDLVVQWAEAVARGFGAFETGLAGHELVVDLRWNVSGYVCKDE